jgi:hypothetical protein
LGVKVRCIMVLEAGFWLSMVMVVLAVELCFVWFYWIPMVEIFMVLLIYMIFTLCTQDLADSLRLSSAVCGSNFCGAFCSRVRLAVSSTNTMCLYTVQHPCARCV